MPETLAELAQIRGLVTRFDKKFRFINLITDRGEELTAEFCQREPVKWIRHEGKDADEGCVLLSAEPVIVNIPRNTTVVAIGYYAERTGGDMLLRKELVKPHTFEGYGEVRFPAGSGELGIWIHMTTNDTDAEG